MKKLYIIMLSGMFLINPALSTIDDVNRATAGLELNIQSSFRTLENAIKELASIGVTGVSSQFCKTFSEGRQNIQDRLKRDFFKQSGCWNTSAEDAAKWSARLSLISFWLTFLGSTAFLLEYIIRNSEVSVNHFISTNIIYFAAPIIVLLILRANYNVNRDKLCHTQYKEGSFLKVASEHEKESIIRALASAYDELIMSDNATIEGRKEKSTEEVLEFCKQTAAAELSTNRNEDR
jgi:hypothetical protein